MENVDPKWKITDYSERAIKLEGDMTRDYIPNLKELNGRFNARLKDGPGWVFPKEKREDVEALMEKIERGEIEKTDPRKSTALSTFQRGLRQLKELKLKDQEEILQFLQEEIHARIS